MMREIKFRAWDKKYGWMDVGPFWVENDGATWDDAQDRYDTPHREIERTDDLILMQYTGLRDKNGVEIYEGDIVCGSWDGRPIQGTVEYQPPSFVMRFPEEKNWREFIFHYTGPQPVEVIGNVHEHPELLEVK